MNLNTLRYVVAVHEEKNFTAAAKRLFISQPSLSQNIRALEEQLGIALFDRQTSPVTTTRAGEAYVQWAKQTLLMYQQTQRQLADIIEGSNTRLSIGASAERTRYLLPPVIKQFFNLRPQCKVRVWDVASAQLLGLLDSGEIDLILGFPEQDTIRYTSEFICEERILIAVPAGYALNLPKTSKPFPPIDLKRFKNSPFISLKSEQVLGRTLLQYCSTCGFIPDIRLECRLLNNLHDMVVAGAGVGLVTEPFVRRYRNDTYVRYYSLSDLPTIQHISAVYRNDRYLSQDANLFISLLQAQANLKFLNPSSLEYNGLF